MGSEIENNKCTVVGNMAAMREALELCQRVIHCAIVAGILRGDDAYDALDRSKAALSSPPRNCDLPLVVDGPANNNADKAWLVFKRYNPDAHFDVSGLLRCIDWLLAPAAAKSSKL